MPTPTLPNLSITTDRLGKRFGRQWIIKDLSLSLSAGEVIGVQGRNGSGKSTLLRMLCGQLTPSRGKVTWQSNNKQTVKLDDWYRYVSWTGPYTELVEELTVAEHLAFNFAFKPLLSGITVEDLPERVGLHTARNRSLLDCSSGMRQRVLLGGALYAATPLLLLDEPTVTLDSEAAAWFQRELTAVKAGRLVVIASNDPADLEQCTRTITLNSTE